MFLVLVATALIAGGLLAVQASANLQLTKAVGTPYGASTLQLSLAAGLLLVLATAGGALTAIPHLAEVPAWQLMGGLASPLYITSGILLFPRLGALAAVGLFVTGQMLASLGLDLFGWLGIVRRPLTAAIVVGALAVLVGIALIIRDHQPGAARGRRVTDTGWVLLGVVAGAGLPIQGAVNARLREGVGEPLAVALVSFTVASLAIAALLVVLLSLRATTPPRVRHTAAMPWWGWLGGACAVVYVTATFVLIPVIGAATTVVLTVTGQQLASALIDSRGLLRMPRRDLSGPRALGLALLIAGSILIQLT